MIQDSSPLHVDASLHPGSVWRELGFSLAFLALLLPSALRAQSANDGFNVSVDSHVTASVVLPDGKLLIGGYFAKVNGQTRMHLARLHVDGSLDSGFVDIDNDGGITSMALVGDGGVLIGGEFTHFGACQCAHLARLNSDGSVDLTYHPNPDGAVNAITRERDGRILIGGQFAHFGASTHHYIARINGEGSIDETYPPPDGDPDQPVSAIAVLPDGKSIIAGAFTTIGVQAASRVARLNIDGSVDNTFVAPQPIDAPIYALAVRLDGKIVIGGAFTTIDGNSRPYLARLNPGGALDAPYPVTDGFVYALTIQPDGKLLAGGNFFLVGDQEANKIARFNVDDTFDTGFRPPYVSTAYITSSVRTMGVQPDGRIVAGGAYTQFDAAFSAVGRLNIDGSLDTSFNIGASNGVFSIAEQPDGKILIGGYFTSLNNGAIPRHHVARLNANGSVDNTFDPDAAGGNVLALAVQSDGRILMGGDFTALGGGATPRSRIARLSPGGSVDGTFDPGANDVVNAITLQSDGKILIGGEFTTLNGGATTRHHIARINDNGSVDGTFNPDANNTVFGLALQPDGMILAYGSFTTLNGGATTRNHAARLDPNGNVDGTFDPDANDSIYALELQPDGKVLIAGAFTRLKGGAVTRHYVARLNADGSVDDLFNPDANHEVYGILAQPDGTILIDGAFTTLDGGAVSRNYVARLNSDGSVDGSFDAKADLPLANALSIAQDGRILVGGGFAHIGGATRARLARLSTRQPSLPSVEVNGSVVNWFRSGSGAELDLPPELYLSTDGSSYELVGTMHRIVGGWRYSGLPTQQVDSVFYLRVLGNTSTGYLNSSRSLIQYTRQVVGTDRIFGDGFELVF